MSKTGVQGVDWWRGRVRARVTVNGKRYPLPDLFLPDKHTPLNGLLSPALKLKIERAMEKHRQTIVAQVEDLGENVRPNHRPRTVTGDTMDVEVRRFWRRIEGKARFKSDRSHLRGVCATEIRLTEKGPLVRVGSMLTSDFTTEVLDLCIAAWETAPTKRAVRRVRVTAHERDGVEMPGYERAAPATSGRVMAPKTIRHRVRVVREMWHTLFPTAGNPAIDAKQPVTPKPNPIGVPQDVIIAVGHKLAAAIQPRTRRRPPRDPEAYALREAKRQREARLAWVRYVVNVTTGQRPCQIGRALPDDIQLEGPAPVWIVRDAKFEPAHILQLTTQMVKALEAFKAADAWGDGDRAKSPLDREHAYDTTTQGNRVHAAGWPKGIRPYASRHSIVQDGTNLYGVDLVEMQTVTGHRQIETLKNSYEGTVVDGRHKRVAQQLEGRLKELFDLRVVNK